MADMERKRRSSIGRTPFSLGRVISQHLGFKIASLRLALILLAGGGPGRHVTTVSTSCQDGMRQLVMALNAKRHLRPNRPPLDQRSDSSNPNMKPMF